MKYFTIPELSHSDTAVSLGIDNTPSKEHVANLERLVAHVLDPLRESWGGPICVSSGYRCPMLNKEVGGVEGSYHTRGMAADIYDPKGLTEGLFWRLRELYCEHKVPITECYYDHKHDYIHVAYNPAEDHAWPFWEK
ncbi:MAG: peptidase M15 [Bacteroidaceae bacterium]|nr:peptidase M15 [Bacteroidaceae bacterium]